MLLLLGFCASIKLVEEKIKIKKGIHTTMLDLVSS